MGRARKTKKTHENPQFILEGVVFFDGYPLGDIDLKRIINADYVALKT